MLAVGLPRGSN